MDDVISQTKAEFNRAKDRLAKLLDKTPDDKLTWSPSATSRTPLELVAHSASSIGGIMMMLQGQPMNIESLAAFDAQMRESEKQYKSREQVLALLNEKSAAFLSYVDSLSPEQLAEIVHGPMGPMPRAAALSFPSYHTRGHIAQLEYVQTIWGDRAWYF